MTLFPTRSRLLGLAVAAGAVLALSGCVAYPYGDAPGYASYPYAVAPGYASPVVVGPGYGYAYGYGPGYNRGGWDHGGGDRGHAERGGSPPVAQWRGQPHAAPAPSPGAAPHYRAAPAPQRGNVGGPEGGPSR